MFNKEQYLYWLKMRGPEGTWDLEDCRAADAHIRSEALINARQWVGQNCNPPAAELLNTLIHAHYGSVEIDEFLQQINAYPEWIEKGEANDHTT